jgi:hypothetical protein|tara:strand:- start:38960 stop:39181 length:222 start_codon:yes stop_codon:yes gene_type:complete
MSLSNTQKNSVKSLYTAIYTPLQTKYGESLQVESVRFIVDSGIVTGMEAIINIETPPDVDGDTTRVRKTIDLW